MEENIETPIASADDVVAAFAGQTVVQIAERCSSASPNGVLGCELEAHSKDVPHQFTFRGINGPQVTYWF